MGFECTPAQATEWIERFHLKFKDVHNYLEACKAAVLNPGYLTNPFGRHRRFPFTADKRLVAQYQREALNFPIQSTVGDAMTYALINMWEYKRYVDPTVDYRILLSVHDAILIECYPEHVEKCIEEVFPICMSEKVEVPKIGLHFTLGDIDVMTRWGEHEDPNVLLEMGVPRKYCGFKDKK